MQPYNGVGSWTHSTHTKNVQVLFDTPFLLKALFQRHFYFIFLDFKKKFQTCLPGQKTLLRHCSFFIFFCFRLSRLLHSAFFLPPSVKCTSLPNSPFAFSFFLLLLFCQKGLYEVFMKARFTSVIKPWDVWPWPWEDSEIPPAILGWKSLSLGGLHSERMEVYISAL